MLLLMEEAKSHDGNLGLSGRAEVGYTVPHKPFLRASLSVATFLILFFCLCSSLFCFRDTQHCLQNIHEAVQLSEQSKNMFHQPQKRTCCSKMSLCFQPALDSPLYVLFLSIDLSYTYHTNGIKQHHHTQFLTFHSIMYQFSSSSVQGLGKAATSLAMSLWPRCQGGQTMNPHVPSALVSLPRTPSWKE